VFVIRRKHFLYNKYNHLEINLFYLKFDNHLEINLFYLKFDKFRDNNLERISI